MNHTNLDNELDNDKCDFVEKKEIPFLDTSVSKVEGKIHTDLYKTPTDNNQYLLPCSCQPPETTKSIPFSLALSLEYKEYVQQKKLKNLFNIITLMLLER